MTDAVHCFNRIDLYVGRVSVNFFGQIRAQILSYGLTIIGMKAYEDGTQNKIQ